MKNCLPPNWSAPPSVCAFVTTRKGGVSQTPYDSFNLADHVGDNAQCVARNRQRLCEMLSLPQEPQWLRQAHGTRALIADEIRAISPPEADASHTQKTGVVCAVLTADCLPILLCDRQGAHVAAIHAGWKGLAAGIIEATINAMNTRPHQLLAWLGPAIGPRAFEVGPDVYQAFLPTHKNAASAFTPFGKNKWLADIYMLARQKLVASGVTAVDGGDFCTYTDQQRFFSYRRDGEKTGRMAAVIWIKSNH